MYQVKLNNVLIDADKVIEALNLLTLQDEPHRLELSVSDDQGDRSYTIDAQGNVCNLGKNKGNHWLVAEYTIYFGDQSYPDAIALVGDRYIAIYALELWEIAALGRSSDRLTIALYTDCQGLVTWCCDENMSVQELAEYFKSLDPDDLDSDPDGDRD